MELTLTSAAKQHINHTLANAGDDVIGIRLGVKPTGCSGLSYVIDFAKTTDENDIVETIEEIKFIVEKSAYDVIKGTELDCVQEGLNFMLKFNNPNATAECGCGESFTVAQKT